MIATVLAAVISKMSTDATLIGYLGGAFVYPGWLTENMTIPCVTAIENNESSTPRVGYAVYKNRDNAPMLQIDIWISRDDEDGPNTIEDIEQIVNRIDVLFIGDNVANTRSWRRVSSSGPSKDPDDQRLIHKSLRYGFEYKVTD